MPRSIWKGAISFGLVSVPVGLYSATERAERIHFRLLHAKDESPIDYRRVCEAEGAEVPWSEIVKGYEVSKGEFVVMTDKDFARARPEATQTFAIRDFVPARAIDFLYFDTPYYLAPQGKAAAKSYALLRDALAKAEREMGLALQLIDTLATDWDPKRYRDTYHEELRKAIEAKLEGKEISVPAPRKPARVVSLATALEQSLKTPRRDLARAPGRRRAAAHA